MNKIADIDRRFRESRRLKSELAAMAHACDGNDRPDCRIIKGLAGTQKGGWSSLVISAAVARQTDQKFEKFQIMPEVPELVFDVVAGVGAAEDNGAEVVEVEDAATPLCDCTNI